MSDPALPPTSAPDGPRPDGQRPDGNDTLSSSSESVRSRGLIRLGSVAGVPVFVSGTWLLLATLIMLTYAGHVRDRVDVSVVGSYAVSLAFALALLMSVLVHELAHVAAARVVRMRVRRVVLSLLGGASELEGEPIKPSHDLLVAVSGPIASVLLAGLFELGARVAGAASAVGVVLGLLAWSNAVLGVFNLLPGLPLDGGRALQALAWAVTGSRERGSVIAAWVGRVLAGLLGVGVLLGNSWLQAHGASAADTFISTGFGLAVSAFLWMAATRTLHVAEIGGRAAALHVGHLVRPAIYLPPQTPIAEALRQVGLARAAGIVVVDADGRSRAIVREASVSAVPYEQRPWATIADVSRPLEPGLVVTDTTTGTQLLQALQRTPASEYLVVGNDGVSRCVIATVDVARALGLSVT